MDWRLFRSGNHETGTRLVSLNGCLRSWFHLVAETIEARAARSSSGSTVRHHIRRVASNMGQIHAARERFLGYGHRHSLKYHECYLTNIAEDKTSSYAELFHHLWLLLSRIYNFVPPSASICIISLSYKPIAQFYNRGPYIYMDWAREPVRWQANGDKTTRWKEHMKCHMGNSKLR